MAINIDKGGTNGKYYFRKNNIVYGPFLIEYILPHIDSDTQIKVLNSNWCPAIQLQDFAPYFNTKNVVPEISVNNDRKDESPKKSKIRLFILFLFLLFIFFGAYKYFIIQKEKQETQLKQQKFIIDSIAKDVVYKQEFYLAQQDSIDVSINNRIEALKKQENIIKFIQRSEELLSKIKNHYLDITNDIFYANNYYADSVKQYITIKNTTANEINILHNNKDDFMNQNFIVYDSTFKYINEVSNIYFFNYSIYFSCFRTKRNQIQKCDVDIEIGFDEDMKIKSYKEIDIRNLVFE